MNILRLFLPSLRFSLLEPFTSLPISSSLLSVCLHLCLPSLLAFPATNLSCPTLLRAIILTSFLPPYLFPSLTIPLALVCLHQSSSSFPVTPLHSYLTVRLHSCLISFPLPSFPSLLSSLPYCLFIYAFPFLPFPPLLIFFTLLCVIILTFFFSSFFPSPPLPSCTQLSLPLFPYLSRHYLSSLTFISSPMLSFPAFPFPSPPGARKGDRRDGWLVRS